MIYNTDLSKKSVLVRIFNFYNDHSDNLIVFWSIIIMYIFGLCVKRNFCEVYNLLEKTKETINYTKYESNILNIILFLMENIKKKKKKNQRYLMKELKNTINDFSLNEFENNILRESKIKLIVS